jgi:hypothetical protein
MSLFSANEHFGMRHMGVVHLINSRRRWWASRRHKWPSASTLQNRRSTPITYSWFSPHFVYWDPFLGHSKTLSFWRRRWWPTTRPPHRLWTVKEVRMAPDSFFLHKCYLFQWLSDTLDQEPCHFDLRDDNDGRLLQHREVVEQHECHIHDSHPSFSNGTHF